MQKLIRTPEKLCIQQSNNSKQQWRYLSLGKFREIREYLWEVKELYVTFKATIDLHWTAEPERSRWSEFNAINQHRDDLKDRQITLAGLQIA